MKIKDNSAPYDVNKEKPSYAANIPPGRTSIPLILFIWIFTGRNLYV